MTRRTLKRPPNGWARGPNYLLKDALALIWLLFCGAVFFEWASAALAAIIGL